MEELETRDIQGLVARGYGHLPVGRFLLLEVADPALARSYLQGICDHVDTVFASPGDVAIQVAFTHAGLAALGVPESALATFSREFIEGMDDEVRAVSLGDEGDNDPRTWTWGRTWPEPPRVHVLLLVYARNDNLLERRVAVERATLEAGAFRVVAAKPATLLPDQKEHLGWKDGLSTPVLEGLGREKSSWTGPIRPGEFVLGYLNEYDCYNESPTADPADDPANHLIATRDGTAKDLGRNGTYLVYREMTQDVLKLWEYLEASSKEPGADPVASAIALGAKMVGRWPEGAPIITSPDRHDPGKAKDNSFTYWDDRGGLGCPLGAHIRRANPRDHLPSDRDRADSAEMVRKHQMLRRGRPFGRPLAPSMLPRDFLAQKGKPDGEVRGLHFICLVGHINRQFEFVQRAWIHSANFGALFKDGDPISAARRPPGHENPNDEFTCPAIPLRRKYKRMPQFTRVVGGSYFFLPGIKALRFIARQP
jgi:Dyp-type peroxidase family